MILVPLPDHPHYLWQALVQMYALRDQQARWLVYCPTGRPSPVLDGILSSRAASITAWPDWERDRYNAAMKLWLVGKWLTASGYVGPVQVLDPDVIPTGQPVPVRPRLDCVGRYLAGRWAAAGAWRWMSTGTTNTSWTVVTGNTGWRNVKSLLTHATWSDDVTTQVFLRRTESGVFIAAVFPGATHSHIKIMNWPAGYAPIGNGAHGGGYLIIGGDTVYKGFLNIHAGGLYAMSASAGGSNPSTSGSFPCDSPWPTTLPGTAA